VPNQDYKPLLVISVHGIRTVGRWQKTLGDVLSRPSHAIPYKAYDFGCYGLLRFLSHAARERQIDKFYDFYGGIVEQKDYGIDLDNYRRRPSIVAHSFGTYVVGSAMLKYPDVKFDKIILCGSILPRDFDWATLFHRDQVSLVRNEFGVRDIWTAMVDLAIEDAGASGADGFLSLSTVISQERYEYFRHSDYFHASHMESAWLPVFSREPSPLQIRHGRNMDDDLASFVRTLEETAAIDDLCFSQFQEFREFEIPMRLASEWIEVEPDIYTFLFDRATGQARGYVNAMPVTDSCFEKLSKGLLRDLEVCAEDLVPFLHDQRVKLYLMSIAIDPGLRKASQGLFQEPFERLANAFLGKLLYYAVNHHVRVTEVVSVAWTVQGRKLCEFCGMQPAGVDRDNHPIYRLDLTADAATLGHSLLPGVRKLAEVYRDMDMKTRSA
jgi:pimeloyl-ACP methyl ester carboxylesterase